MLRPVLNPLLRMSPKRAVLLALCVAFVMVSGCANQINSLGGTVQGLSGTLVLQNNGGDTITITSNGSFTFPTKLDEGDGFTVTVLQQPVGQYCAVDGGTGLSYYPINSIVVTCTNGYTVGGTVTGLTGTVYLNDSATIPVDGLSVTATGSPVSFVFRTQVLQGSNYSVTVTTQPTGQNCSVATTGIGTMGSVSVTNVAVTCSSTTIKQLFVLPTGVAGNLGGITGADALCQANIPSASTPQITTAKALIVDGTSRIACVTGNGAAIGASTPPSCTSGSAGQVGWVLAPSTTYIQYNGSIVSTTDTNGFFSFPLANLVVPTATTPTIWTGMNADWSTDTGNTCSSWSDSTSASNGAFGYITGALGLNQGLLNSGPTPCTSLEPLVCVQQ